MNIGGGFEVWAAGVRKRTANKLDAVGHARVEAWIAQMKDTGRWWFEATAGSGEVLQMPASWSRRLP